MTSEVGQLPRGVRYCICCRVSFVLPRPRQEDEKAHPLVTCCIRPIKDNPLLLVFILGWRSTHPSVTTHEDGPTPTHSSNTSFNDMYDCFSNREIRIDTGMVDTGCKGWPASIPSRTPNNDPNRPISPPPNKPAERHLKVPAREMGFLLRGRNKVT